MQHFILQRAGGGASFPLVLVTAALGCRTVLACPRVSVEDVCTHNLSEAVLINEPCLLSAWRKELNSPKLCCAAACTTVCDIASASLQPGLGRMGCGGVRQGSSKLNCRSPLTVAVKQTDEYSPETAGLLQQKTSLDGDVPRQLVRSLRTLLSWVKLHGLHAAVVFSTCMMKTNAALPVRHAGLPGAFRGSSLTLRNSRQRSQYTQGKELRQHEGLNLLVKRCQWAPAGKNPFPIAIKLMRKSARFQWPTLID